MILYFRCEHDNQKHLNGVLRKSLIFLCILYLKFYNRSKSKSKCLICKGQCSPSSGPSPFSKFPYLRAVFMCPSSNMPF